MGSASRFNLLVVCTGNICRSPLTERILQAGLDRANEGAFSVSSAGTQALVGRPMTPQIEGLTRVMGGSSSNFAARQLTPELLEQADLVLALSRGHRSRILELAPSVLRRTFTLREFGRMVEFVRYDADTGARAAKAGLGSEPGLEARTRWESLIPRAAAVRFRTLAGSENDDDVVDPYRQSDETHSLMLRQIAPAVEILVNFEQSCKQIDSLW
ncbi:arsenate reductase/protein-tyrosine-phosphatase family protein [Arthrobacter sp. MMS24-S77]